MSETDRELNTALRRSKRGRKAAKLVLVASSAQALKAVQRLRALRESIAMRDGQRFKDEELL